LRVDLDTGLPGCADERQKEAIKPQYPAVFHAKISKTESVKKTGLTLAEPAKKIPRFSGALPPMGANVIKSPCG
jgi:hypothetical protein